MANQKISELNELLSPLSGDTLPIVNNGETKKITVSNLVSVSNVQPYFEATDTGSAQNYKVGDNVWLGDVGQQNTLLVKGIQESGSAYIKFGDSNGAHQHPYIGHDTNEDANVLSMYADTTKISNALIVGSGSLVFGNPEMLHVYSSGSFNIAHFIGQSETYSQINVQNLNTGSDASSDIVVTANNGTEQNHFIDLGINSSNYNAGVVGYANDAYLLNVGNDMYVGTIGGGVEHSHLHLFSAGDWQNPQITLFAEKSIGFNTTSVVSGYTYEFSGSAQFNHNLKVDGNIQGGGNLYLQPDVNDSRYLEIYNTAPADIHIRGNAAYTFFGDDTNYMKVDSGAETITINTTNGTTINNLLKLSPVGNLPSGSTLGDMVVSGSNLYFHTDSSWMKVMLVPVIDSTSTPTPEPTSTSTPTPTPTETPLPATSTPTPEPTSTSTPTPTSTPTETPLPATSTPTPEPTSTSTPTPEPTSTPTPTPTPKIQIINTNTTRSVTSLQISGNTVTLDGGSYPILNGVGYKMDGVTADAGSIILNFGGSGFFTTFKVYKNDVEEYNLPGYANSSMVMGGTSLTTSDYLRIELS